MIKRKKERQKSRTKLKQKFKNCKIYLIAMKIENKSHFIEKEDLQFWVIKTRAQLFLKENRLIIRLQQRLRSDVCDLGGLEMIKKMQNFNWAKTLMCGVSEKNN